jgi:hypothetical protein
MIRLLRNKEYNIKPNYTNKKIYKILENQCINDLKQDKLEYFYKLLETKLYNIIILIDGKEDIKIEKLYHNIQILFINNIQNNVFVLQNLLLVDIDLEHYYFMTIDGSIMPWNKKINRNQIGIKYNDIVLEPTLLLEFIDPKQIKFTSKLTKYIKSFTKNIAEIIITYILIFTCMFYQFYLLVKTIINY